MKSKRRLWRQREWVSRAQKRREQRYARRHTVGWIRLRGPRGFLVERPIVESRGTLEYLSTPGGT